ncbi:MAG: DNA sulfur modification protein DndD [Methyloprofundus sp.]|nr:DNA sulfur modification protein DndD [Methyloprofundus sp.]
MIFKNLTIQNFGIYQGKHSIDLTVENDKPIILLGALNGGGKTTFLDAIQLVLYGKHAKCSNRTGMAYSNFLSSCKNRYAPANSEVMLSLSFSHRTDNIEKHFTVQRRWEVKGLEVKDYVHVLCDFQYDEHLSLHWDDFVNEFIPLNLSDLFFFDGEKIENLAHPQRSSELVKTGIENLLGLDLLSQLQIDLSQLDKKRSSTNVDLSVLPKIEACENEIKQISTLKSELKKEIAALEKELSIINISINRARQSVRNSGAHLIEKRDEIKFELGAIEAKLKLNKAEQNKLSAGVGPLRLVKPLIEKVKAQIRLENETKKLLLLNETINDYEAAVLERLKFNHKAGNDIIELVRNTMKSIAQERNKSTLVECYLNTELNIFNGLEERITLAKEQQQRMQRKELDLLEQKELLLKQIETIPDYNSVKHQLSELAEQEATLKQIEESLQEKRLQLEQTEIKNNVLSQRYTNMLAQQNKETFEQKRSIQIGEHINKVKATLQDFAEQLISENIERLQTLIKQKFDKLGRKDHLITGFKISPETFEITLYDASNNPLEPAKLSAGERQLLAIAILWGLAEASGKELPTVIDTPLSRLDGKHRNNLTKNYFPEAGKQVILLSTDEEIVGDYYEQLKPKISREYYLRYNEKAKSSTFIQGYF